MWGLLGGLVSAAASLAGGRQSQRSNERMAAGQERLQREFAQHGIRWKVEDAKAAGLHPLYALGAQTTPYSPVAVQDSRGPAMAEAGQHVGRAIAATSTRAENQLQALAIEEAKARIGETDARRQFYLSEAARNAQNQTPGIPHESQHAQFGTASVGRTTPPEDAKVITSVPGDKATADGPTPIWRKFWLSGDLPIVLPGGMQGDAAEVLESIMESFPAMMAVYKENKHRFGDAWAEKFLKRYMPFGEHFFNQQARSKKLEREVFVPRKRPAYRPTPSQIAPASRFNAR